MRHNDGWAAFDKITGWRDLCFKAPLLKEGEDNYVNKLGSQTGHNS
jgi:hypothetical protein